MGNTDSTKKDELREYIKDAECTGPHCNHETAETHYLVFDDIFGLIESAKAEAEIAQLKWAHDRRQDGDFHKQLDDRIAELKAQQEEK